MDSAAGGLRAPEELLAYASYGLALFPLDGHRPACKRGFYDASRGRAWLCSQWALGKYAWAYATGPVLVLDVDSYKPTFDLGELRADDLKTGVRLAGAKDRARDGLCGHWMFRGLDPEPPRQRKKPQGRDYYPYDLSGGMVSIGQNLGGSNGVDWRAWGGYARVKRPLPCGIPPIDELPVLPETIEGLLRGKKPRRGTRGPDIQGMSMKPALDVLGWELRYNTRGKRIELRRPRSETPVPVWGILDDRSEARLREAFASTHGLDRLPTDVAWRVAVDRWLYDFEVDPFRQWLEGLAPWDETVRLPNLLESAFRLARPARDLAPWASLYPCLGAVQRTYEPGCKLDEVPILIGPQGIGKSAFLACLFPPDLRAEAFSDRLDFATNPKRQVETMQGKVLIELAELTGLTRGRLDAVKAFVTSVSDGDIRLAFRRNPDTMLRQCVMVGTANPDPNGILPADSTGSRRWGCIHLTASLGPVEPLLDATREQLWAEAIARYQRGERANLHRGLSEVQAAANDLYRHRDDTLEDAVEALARGPWPAVGLTLAEVAERLGLLDVPGWGGDAPPTRPATTLTRREQMRLADALRLHGCHRERRSVDGHQAWRWSAPVERAKEDYRGR